MGFGLPAGLAAKTVQPHRQVVIFTGDGGLSMSLAEFATAVQYHLPVTVVVTNNGTLAMEQNRMLVGGFRPTGVELVNPDFAAFAHAAGPAWDSGSKTRTNSPAPWPKPCIPGGPPWWTS